MKRINYVLTYEEFINENGFIANKRKELTVKAVFVIY